MHPPEVFRATTLRVAALLDAHRIRYHLTGGIASVAYGEPRMTQDIDIVVDNAALADCLDAFIDAAQRDGFLLDARAVRHGVASRSMFQMFDMDDALKVDIYPREMVPGELGRSAWVEVFAGIKLPLVSRPDAAASKLAWAAKGSQKSRRDVRHIVRQMKAQDRAALDNLARDMRLEALLADVLAEPDEISG